jgi:hypothetical protein
MFEGHTVQIITTIGLFGIAIFGMIAKRVLYG